IARRYHADDVLPRLFKRERPGGRLLVLEGDKHSEQPLMLTEFGGIALAARYERLLRAVRSVGLLSGFCYTQFTDTYQEANGLLYADRTPKFAIERIRAATCGPVAMRTDGLEQIESHAESSGHIS